MSVKDTPFSVVTVAVVVKLAEAVSVAVLIDTEVRVTLAVVGPATVAVVVKLVEVVTVAVVVTCSMPVIVLVVGAAVAVVVTERIDVEVRVTVCTAKTLNGLLSPVRPAAETDIVHKPVLSS